MERDVLHKDTLYIRSHKTLREGASGGSTGTRANQAPKLITPAEDCMKSGRSPNRLQKREGKKHTISEEGTIWVQR